jgi:hypothetical protein
VSTVLRVMVLSALFVLGGEPSPTAREHTAGNSVDLAGVQYPLDAFELSEGERETVTAARYVLTRQCVRRFGLDLPARPAGPVRAPQDDRYGLTDETQARTWGYSQDAPPKRAMPCEMAIDTRSPLYAVVHGMDVGGRPATLAGLPGGGCRGAADRVLQEGTQPGGGNPVPELDDRAWRTSRQDPAVAQAATAWQRCMAKGGHRIRQPRRGAVFLLDEAADGREPAAHRGAAANRGAVQSSRTPGRGRGRVVQALVGIPRSLGYGRHRRPARARRGKRRAAHRVPPVARPGGAQRRGESSGRAGVNPTFAKRPETSPVFHCWTQAGRQLPRQG